MFIIIVATIVIVKGLTSQTVSGVIRLFIGTLLSLRARCDTSRHQPSNFWEFLDASLSVGSPYPQFQGQPLPEIFQQILINQFHPINNPIIYI